MLSHPHLKSFTLLELLIVIGILAVLATVLIAVIRPAEMLKQSRDAARLAQFDSLRSALNIAMMDDVNLGSLNTVYISLPSNNPQCSDLSLPPLPDPWVYHCSNSTNYRNIDGTGWIPINFKSLSVGSPLSALPQDPINNTTYYYTYTTGGSYELTALLESTEKHEPAIDDGDAYPGLYAVGTSLNLTPRTRDQNLVGYWKMDEDSWTNDCSTLTVKDSSGKNNHGKACPNANGPYTTSGKVNRAGYFDGTDDYINYGNGSSINILNNLTLAAWVKSNDETQKDRGIIGKWGNGGYLLWLASGNGRVTLVIDNGPYNYSSVILDDDNWYFLVGTVENTNITKLYINGVLQSTTSGGQSLYRNSGYSLELGRYVNSNSTCFKGYLDDVRIYNRALSAEEIQAIYNATQ